MQALSSVSTHIRPARFACKGVQAAGFASCSAKLVSTAERFGPGAPEVPAGCFDAKSPSK